MDVHNRAGCSHAFCAKSGMTTVQEGAIADETVKNIKKIKNNMQNHNFSSATMLTLVKSWSHQVQLRVQIKTS